MDAELRARLDAIVVLLAVIASGVLGLAWVQGGFETAATIFVLGAMVAAFLRRPEPAPRESGDGE